MKGKHITLCLACLLLSSSIHAQELNQDKSKNKAYQTLYVKWTFLPVLFESGFAGNLETDHNELRFVPKPCNSFQKKNQWYAPCNTNSDLA